MLAQSKLLGLVRRAYVSSIDLVGRGQKTFVNQARDHLAVFEKRGDSVRAYFEHRMAALERVFGAPAEPGIEKPGVVDSKLAGGWIERKNLGCPMRRKHHFIF